MAQLDYSALKGLIMMLMNDAYVKVDKACPLLEANDLVNYLSKVSRGRKIPAQ